MVLSVFNWKWIKHTHRHMHWITNWQFIRVIICESIKIQISTREQCEINKWNLCIKIKIGFSVCVCNNWAVQKSQKLSFLTLYSYDALVIEHCAYYTCCACYASKWIASGFFYLIEFLFLCACHESGCVCVLLYNYFIFQVENIVIGVKFWLWRQFFIESSHNYTNTHMPNDNDFDAIFSPFHLIKCTLNVIWS